MNHLRKANRIATALLLLIALASCPSAPAAWALDNPPPGPTIDVDCTDPDSATTCRECHIDGPIFCCPENEPCLVKHPPKVALPAPRPARRGLGANRYFTR